MRNGLEGKVSVVVPTYNEERNIEAFLSSMLRQTLPPYEILVVDSRSNDGTREAVQNYREQCIKKHITLRLITLNQRGITVARDKGFRLAKSTYIASCDADTRYSKNYLQSAVTWLDTHKNTDYVAVAGDPTSFASPPWYITISHALSFFYNNITLLLFKGIVIIRGFNIVFLRNAYLKSSGLDTTIYAVEDEIGLSRSLRQIGKIGYNPHQVTVTSDRAVNKGVFHYFFLMIIVRYWGTYLINRFTPLRFAYKRVD